MISYELKLKKLKQEREKIAQKARIWIFLGTIFAYILLQSGLKNSKILLLLMLVLIAWLAYEIIMKNIAKNTFLMKKELFNNEFLPNIAKRLGVVFKPFGAFFLQDFDGFYFKKNANHAVCDTSFVGEINDFNAKMGDLKLERKRQKKHTIGLGRYFGLGDEICFDGFVAKFEFKNAFLGQTQILQKGCYSTSSGRVKLLEISKNSPIFDIYSNDEILSANLNNCLIKIAQIQALCDAKTEFYMDKNTLLICVYSDKFFRFFTPKNRKNFEFKMPNFKNFKEIKFDMNFVFGEDFLPSSKTQPQKKEKFNDKAEIFATKRNFSPTIEPKPNPNSKIYEAINEMIDLAKILSPFATTKISESNGEDDKKALQIKF